MHRRSSRVARRLSRPLIAVIAAQLLFQPGCLMMFNGSTQAVGLSSNPGGAKVVVNDAQTYTTPATISLDRKLHHTLVFEKEGYQNASESVSSSLNGFFLLDVLLWGPFALLDFTNGSAYKLSTENVDVILVPKPAAMSPSPAPTAAGVPAAGPTPAHILEVPPASQVSPTPNAASTP